MAWTTPLGDSLDGVWSRLLAGETGLAPAPSGQRLRNDLAGMIPALDHDLVPSAQLAVLAQAAIERALQESGTTAGDACLVIGTSFGSYLEDDPPESSAHAWGDRLAEAMGFAQPPLVVSTACSSGSDAIALAAELIRAGETDRCVCGGVDILTPAKRMNHSALQTLSPTTLRAFDTRHDGTIFGEGAGFVVLEREHADPVARLNGIGQSSDASGMTAPDVTGRAVDLAIERALDDAGLKPEDIDVVNAHASGTGMNDETEREGLRTVFCRNLPTSDLRPPDFAKASSGKPTSDLRPPTSGLPVVFGTKGNFGHSLGATGAVEAMATILALQSGKVPPVYGLEQPDPEFPLPLPMGTAMECEARYGISVTLGFGGFDTCLVFEKGE